jgi:hypothetical protein
MQLPFAHKDKDTETDKSGCLRDNTSFVYKGDSKGTDESKYLGYATFCPRG